MDKQELCANIGIFVKQPSFFLPAGGWNAKRVLDSPAARSEPLRKENPSQRVDQVPFAVVKIE